MFKIYISAAFLCISGGAKAYKLIDSVGVNNVNGKQVIIHQIEKKETYFSLGQKYKVDYKEIIKHNNNAILRVGTLIQVPTQRPFTNANSIKNSPATKPNNTTSAGHTTTHIVAKGETLYGIARMYNISPQQIKEENHLQSGQLRLNQELKITSNQNTSVEKNKEIPKVENKNTPTPIVTSVEEKSKPIQNNAPVSSSKPSIFTHKVGSNETLYSIATRYKTTMNKLVEDNNIQNYQIQIGQVLYINGSQKDLEKQQNTVNSTTDTTRDSNDANITITDPKLRKAPSVYGLSQVDEKGVAMWIEDQDLDNSKMLVLHKNAPVGTIIRITNPVNNRSTFAKVVGSFSENESTKNVVVLMTKAVATAIGAIDKKFYCNINYGISSEGENE